MVLVQRVGPAREHVDEKAVFVLEPQRGEAGVANGLQSEDARAGEGRHELTARKRRGGQDFHLLVSVKPGSGLEGTQVARAIGSRPREQVVGDGRARGRVSRESLVLVAVARHASIKMQVTKECLSKCACQSARLIWLGAAFLVPHASFLEPRPRCPFCLHGGIAGVPGPDADSPANESEAAPRHRTEQVQHPGTNKILHPPRRPYRTSRAHVRPTASAPA
jgi:hypothetical protein